MAHPSETTWCCSLRTATKILGCLFMVGNIRILVVSVPLLSLRYPDTHEANLLVALLYAVVVFAVIDFILSGILFSAGYGENHCATMIWMIGATTIEVIRVIIFVVLCTNTTYDVSDHPMNLAVQVLGVLFYLYALSVVYRFMGVIRAKNLGSGAGSSTGAGTQYRA